MPAHAPLTRIPKLSHWLLPLLLLLIAGLMWPPAPAVAGPVTNSLGMEFVLIPAGGFVMGSPANEPGRDGNEGPQHRVTISRPFYLQTTEVTQGQWRALMGRNPSKFKGDNLPVERVSWNDAQEFIRRLNAREGGNMYRLPTEAEWEYACRAGTPTAYNTGNSIGQGQANYAGRRTMPVKSFAPNRWGLYDMHGNVWEWCGDYYDNRYYAGSPGMDPPGPGRGTCRVMRGGGWNGQAKVLRSANRNWVTPMLPNDYTGLRVARTAE